MSALTAESLIPVYHLFINISLQLICRDILAHRRFKHIAQPPSWNQNTNSLSNKLLDLRPLILSGSTYQTLQWHQHVFGRIPLPPYNIYSLCCIASVWTNLDRLNNNCSLSATICITKLYITGSPFSVYTWPMSYPSFWWWQKLTEGMHWKHHTSVCANRKLHIHDTTISRVFSFSLPFPV